jgi:hypothetical protein
MMTPVGLGLRAIRGGAVVVAVAVEGGNPRVALSTFLATGAEDDRLSSEPYRMAAELKRDPHGRPSAEAASLVAEGRRRQEQQASKGLHAIVRALEEARCKPIVAALLVNRASWVTDLLEYSASWPEHVPVAEGLAVRDALRFACKECRIEVSELDEKSLPDLAAYSFDATPTAVTERLKTLGATVDGPWRKAEKLACLSAWLAVTKH